MNPTPAGEPLETLLQHPRVTSILLNMYEGLARYCEQQDSKGAGRSVDRFRQFYRDRVGIDFSRRHEVRNQIEARLLTEVA